VVLVAACALIPLSVGRRSVKNRDLADRIAWVGLLTIGFFSSLFIATLLRDVFLLGAHLALSAQGAASLVVPSARWTLALTLLSAVIGFVIARRPRLVEVDIPIEDLPKALHGFSIAQISDLHVGATIKRGFVERIVARVNFLKADLIAITGDLVDGSVSDSMVAHGAFGGARGAPRGLLRNGQSRILFRRACVDCGTCGAWALRCSRIST